MNKEVKQRIKDYCDRIMNELNVHHIMFIGYEVDGGFFAKHINATPAESLELLHIGKLYVNTAYTDSRMILTRNEEEGKDEDESKIPIDYNKMN